MNYIYCSVFWTLKKIDNNFDFNKDISALGTRCMGFGIWKIPLMSFYACWTFIIILKNNFGSDFLQGVFLFGTKVRRALFTFAKSYCPMLGKYWLKIPSKGFRTPCRWKLDSGLQSLAGLQVRFRIPKSRSLHSTRKNFHILDSMTQSLPRVFRESWSFCSDKSLRFGDFLSPVTSTQIPKTIKKRCNIDKQHKINKPRRRN